MIGEGIGSQMEKFDELDLAGAHASFEIVIPLLFNPRTHATSRSPT